MILVFGHSGQVASELRRHDGVVALGREAVDLAQPGAAAAAIDGHAPELIINAAAYTAVDRAEDDEAGAMQLNGAMPGEMARAAAQSGIPFVHISTDYVFDGSGTRPWRPGDPTAPLGVYGRSKLAGEEAVLAAGGCNAVLRTSWVFSAHGQNFVKTMLRLGSARDSLSIVADQIGGPTSAASIARAVLAMGRRLQHGEGAGGIYHFSGAPAVSWADFAREIFRQADLGVSVRDIASADYPTTARRPLNSRLDCSETERVFGITQPDWRKCLTAVLAELERHGK
ncbi:MAG TPA: dTDP-4-dehydrorhamnose reductase [Rhodobacteraceae bacterium]|nr:dTDP-4-dehydrorhamnose reductase [Paracoccaceae bacterium]